MMMMMRETPRSNPTVEIPPWDHYDNPTVHIPSPFSVNPNGGNAFSPESKSNYSHHLDELTAFHRYLPSNMNGDDLDEPADAFSCDNFRMFEFKIKRCSRARSHDWTECPYAHPGEKARRRDPRKFHYTGNGCPEFKKGQCVKGDACEFAHGVFECWLHPSRYRTQPCKDGTHCARRVCFFAHTPDQLRVTTQSSPRTESYDGSPSRLGFDSPTSGFYSPPISPPSDSPPASPCGSLSQLAMRSGSLSQLSGSIQNLQIGKVRMSMSPPSWGYQMGSGFCSPRSPSTLRPAFMSLPTTPNRVSARTGPGFFDSWDNSFEEEPAMERVESGRELRAKIYAKLSRENSVGRADPIGSGPDVGWVSELVN